MIDLSLVIVTWNCRKYLEGFFESLGTLLTDRSVQIIVVDNASTDGTPELIREKFPTVDVISSGRNAGFAGGNNIGLAKARGEYICLINPDVKVLPHCFETMMAFMKEHQEIGLLGPQMYGGDGRIHRSTMRFPTVWNYFCNALALDVLFPNMFKSYLMREIIGKGTTEVDVLNGWFWLTRRAALEQVGLLDETFFMYGEDIDWCKRLSDAGWKRVYHGEAASIHYGGGSSSNAPIRFYIEQQKAILQYFKKHQKSSKQVAFVMSMWLYHIIRICGHGAKYLVRYSDNSSLKIRCSMASIRWLLGLTPTSSQRS